MRILLLRHGATRGNLERRYIGVTDEPLSEEGKRRLRSLWPDPPRIGRVYVSPLRRCRETAALLFPHSPVTVVPGLRECDFGFFEGKTYEELKEEKAYRDFLSSGGEVPPPGGEGKAQVRRRTLEAFARVLEREGEREENPEEPAALVAHGGTVMHLLFALAEEERDFYDWHLENGEGIWAEVSAADAGRIREGILGRVPVLRVTGRYSGQSAADCSAWKG